MKTIAKRNQDNMKCLNPILVENGKNRDFVPCGKCRNCLSDRRKQWFVRLRKELDYAHNAGFLTLTYDDENIPYTNEGMMTLRVRHLQLFLKRVRYLQLRIQKRYANAPKWNIRYFAVGEYGGQTQRPHYHIIIFNVLPQVQKEYESLWDGGFIKLGSVTNASINYVAKYVINRQSELEKEAMEIDPTFEKSFSVMSLKPAIGFKYLEDNFERLKKVDYLTIDGVKYPLPDFYRRKLGKGIVFSDLRVKPLNENEIKEKELIDKYEHSDKNYFERLVDTNLYFDNKFKFNKLKH